MTHRLYDTPAWRRLRKRVLARDGYRCQIGGHGCTIRANHCDHIINMSEGGAPLDPANLRAACARCNISKRNTDLANAARRARGERPLPPKPSTALPPYPAWPTRAEHIADIGYDDPPPPYGWRPDHLPRDTPPPEPHSEFWGEPRVKW